MIQQEIRYTKNIDIRESTTLDRVKILVDKLNYFEFEPINYITKLNYVEYINQLVYLMKQIKKFYSIEEYKEANEYIKNNLLILNWDNNNIISCIYNNFNYINL